MTYPVTNIRNGQLGALYGVLLILMLASGCGPSAPPSGPPKPKVEPAKPVTTVSTNTSVEYLSVFEDLPPQIGKDPFFPMSTRRNPAPAAPTPTAQVRVDPVLVLKAIMRTSLHSAAVINNEVMEKGDEEAIRVPNGHIRVRLLEIGEDYVVVQVDGEASTKKLSMEQKK